ncbi:hypothetical protein [Paenibacillus sp. NEAU-GSW1]|uniref:hypothetical protein n=1 Tax=Paenibacillus sp. NEAU-GSW1 TaxID=2682486 RepID=UPI0012E289CD|nr:hypothetical protein [Paenibacillus sp. NEAU-GSW1]MUT67461.1 hypothetical protein [Paenibacillus sp. NEAU-GSW1]
MSIEFERKLTEAFKRSETELELECPPSLDVRIMAEYGRLTMEKRGKVAIKKKWSLSKVVIITATVALMSGFAYAGNKFLFSDTAGTYSIQMQTNESLDLEPDALEKARASLKEIQAQLAPGETAVVYLPEIAAKFEGGHQPALGVTNPIYVSDKSEWKAALTEIGAAMPDDLLGSYQFEAGTKNSPFHYELGMDALDLLNQMQAESEQSEGDQAAQALWRLTDTETNSFVSSYTSVYRDADGEMLQAAWVVFDDPSTRMESFAPPSTVYEELSLSGQKAHYTKFDQSLYGDSSTLQSVMWIEQQEDRTIMHYVESDSAAMTEEKLVEAAQALLNMR